MVNRHSDRDPGRDGSDTAEQAAFRVRARTWHDRHATPRSGDDLWSVPLYVDTERAGEYFNRGRAWQRKLFEHGWAGLTWPRAYGGGGGEPWQARIFSEVAAGYEEAPGFVGATIAMLGPTLLRHGTEDQKRRFVPGLLSGELAFCQLFSEPGAGSDLAGLSMRTERYGDEFVVNGQKVWNSQAQFCDWGFLLVRTNPRRSQAPRHHLPAGANGHTGDRGPSAGADERLRSLQRGLLRPRFSSRSRTSLARSTADGHRPARCCSTSPRSSGTARAPA